ncbi:hypothetical protein EW026_g5411 [Hermanssonia centrifuga]|uniref:Uncharacterized protein n=1 Tax=Hermanssonia centrifuga TaxID=98765 RepID=A0A4V3XA24_9APHY|nr:hypothetical protein EW026_g5411 [Hermanssonia centrifuga]
MPPKRKQTGSSQAMATRSAKKAKTSAKAAPSNVTIAATATTTPPTTTVGEPTAAEPKPTAEPATEPKAKESSPQFTGKFDLYSTLLPFLKSEYLPQGATEPQFETLYEKILFYQAKPDFSMRINIDEAKTGRFTCPVICNPMSDEELEPIYIENGQTKQVAFSETEAAHESTIGTGLGYTAKLMLGDSDGCGCGMVSGGKGTFKMRKVWEGEDEGKGELFEGYWTFKATYGPTLRRKRFGSGNSSSGVFWAVRARKNADGKEIGIDVEV